MLCCSPESSEAWTLGCQGFPRAPTPSLTCLGFPEKKKRQNHRTLISAWIGATASKKKKYIEEESYSETKQQFLSFYARGGQIPILFYTFGRDVIWFIAKTFILHRSVHVPPPAPQPLFLLASSIFIICISPRSPQEEPQHRSSRQNLRLSKSFCSFTLYTQLSFQLLARKYFFLNYSERTYWSTGKEFLGIFSIDWGTWCIRSYSLRMWFSVPCVGDYLWGESYIPKHLQDHEMKYTFNNLSASKPQEISEVLESGWEDGFISETGKTRFWKLCVSFLTPPQPPSVP